MSSWGHGLYGRGPWGGGGFDSEVSPVDNFIVHNSNVQELSLSWDKPSNYSSSQEIIVSRRKDSFPMELFNTDSTYSAKQYVSGFSDPVQIEVFRGRIIRGSNGVGTANTLTDSSATFTRLAGRILRDSNSINYRILSNTTTTITVDGTPSSGAYVVLVDFPNSNDGQLTSTSTLVGSGYLQDTSLSLTTNFYADRILVDSLGNKFVVISNSSNIFSLTGTPAAGAYAILEEFVGYSSSSIFKGQFKYIDTYLNKEEADLRVGSGLEADQFYYYTAFTKNTSSNIAEAVFIQFGLNTSTQSSGLSFSSKSFGDLLYSLWPDVVRVTDTTGDLRDVMSVFGNTFDEIYSYVNTFEITNPKKIQHSLVLQQARQIGLASSDYQLGVDTLRRTVQDLIPAYQKKGSKEGIREFIRLITTWDVTEGTGDSSYIVDSIQNVDAFRFFGTTLGDENSRIFGFEVSFTNDPFVSYTYTSGTGVIQFSSAVDLSLVAAGHVFVDGDNLPFDVVSVNDSLNRLVIATGQTVVTSSNGYVYEKVPTAASGRFYINVPGIVLPGFFDFREFVVNIKDIALFVGESTDVSTSSNSTVLTDSLANFGGTNNLIGNYLIPKQGQINEIFRITSNTSTTITVAGVTKDPSDTGNYAVLSPLNAARYQRIVILMKDYAPSFARMGLNFI